MSKHIMLKYKLIIGSVLLSVRMNNSLETISKKETVLYKTSLYETLYEVLYEVSYEVLYEVLYEVSYEVLYETILFFRKD